MPAEGISFQRHSHSRCDLAVLWLKGSFESPVPLVLATVEAEVPGPSVTVCSADES